MAEEKMKNKEQLINWMKEQRESLPFENKVQLIWDYWKNKDTIPNLRKDVASWKDAYEIERKLAQKLNQKIINKDDRIIQLDQTVKGSAKIFAKQNGINAILRAQLVKESNKSGASKEYIEHCKEDIKRLDQEKQELDTRIKELKQEENKNKELHDKELADLRAEKQELEVKDKQVYDILGEYSTATGLLLRSQEVVEKLKKWTNLFGVYSPEKTLPFLNLIGDNVQIINGGTELQLKEFRMKFHPLIGDTSKIPTSLNKVASFISSLLSLYTKEKFWWDKWIADSKIIFYARNSNTVDILYLGAIGDVSKCPSDNVWINGRLVGQDSIMVKKYKENIKQHIYQYYRNK